MVVWEDGGGGGDVDHSLRRQRQTWIGDWPKNTGATQEPEMYYPTWCGGCMASPISPAEMCEYFKVLGWPADDEVHHDKTVAYTHLTLPTNSDV